MFNDLMDTIGFVEEKDPEVGQAMEKELARQRRNLELIASEKWVRTAVMAAMGAVLTNKYAEGYPGRGTTAAVSAWNRGRDRPEPGQKAVWRDYANVQPHSGAQANLAVFFALLKPGDTCWG